jgi:hypothetical protein
MRRRPTAEAGRVVVTPEGGATVVVGALVVEVLVVDVLVVEVFVVVVAPVPGTH